MRTAPVAAGLLAAFLAPLAGCARSGAPAAGGPPTTLPTEVVLTTSGGIVGLSDTVTVRTDGRWTKVDRSGGSRTGQLSATDLDRLRQLTTDPRLPAEATATTPATMCADAFTYQLTVGERTTGYVDCPPELTPPPATAAVVELLHQATA